MCMTAYVRFHRLTLWIYCRLRLKERNRRKRVARDYSLVNVYTSSFKKGQSGCKKRSAREYKEFQDKMKKFAQFTTMAEHDAFFHNLQSEWEVLCHWYPLEMHSYRYNANNAKSHGYGSTRTYMRFRRSWSESAK